MSLDLPESVLAPNQDAIASAVLNLVAVVARLRDPEQGCPWDREQTPTSLIPYVLEEAYEVVHALRQADSSAIAEELGDLLLQVVLQAQIASETQQFDLATVAEGITEKLIRRHPHVFGEAIAETPEAVQATWQAIKASEKGEVTETLTHRLSRYAATLPPLTAALKISQRAAKAGFEWPDLAGVWDKFEEELAELKEALDSGDRDHAEAELGDLLFSLINIARWCQLDPVAALQGTNDRFVARFQKVEAAAGQPLDSLGIEALEKLWQQAKRELGHTPASVD